MTINNPQTIKNLDRAIKRLEKTISVDGTKAGIALTKVAEAVLEKTEPLTPIDTGYLRQSFVIDKPQTRGNEVSIDIKNTAKYAIYVHELVDRNYRVGGGKFLEKGIQATDKGSILKRWL